MAQTRKEILKQLRKTTSYRTSKFDYAFVIFASICCSIYTWCPPEFFRNLNKKGIQSEESPPSEK